MNGGRIAKKKKIFDAAKLTDWLGFYAELSKETDRGLAIVGAEFLNQHLAQLITNFLVDDEQAIYKLLNPKNIGAPFGTSDALIQAAYCLGLIDEKARYELVTVQTIRNKFTHGLHGVSFATNEIIQLTQELKFTEMLPKRMNVPEPRRRFIFSVALLLQHIAVNAMQVKERRLEPAVDLVWDLTEKTPRWPTTEDLWRNQAHNGKAPA